ncbi:hypothetical protein, conserved [Angomonas deanei]|uniref:Uncharacterized protein n=1 Tax=Angomonas deanei TaxID=59799 RepID=A0A7G2C289_9TRYP|nr:hypothetical protein, conserved [Angomonas deanei]
MELFERVNTKKKAVQEIKSFLKQYFYMDANQGGQVRTEALVAAYQSLQDNKKRETGKKGETNINEIPDLFLPADFVSAQNSDVRNVLYLRRREEKLNILREADEKLYCYALETLRQENARIKDPQHSGQTTSPTEVTADNGVCTPPSAIENIQQEKTDPQVGRKKSNTVHILSSDEEEDGHLESHKIINTGCFGFSFLSRFD